MLRITQVKKHFGGVKALNNCSLKIKEGKITALIGPNGSGKTTLFNVISQIIDEDSGRLFLDKIEITNYLPNKVAKAGISRTFQEVRLFSNLTVKEHLEIAMNQENESILKSLFKRKKNNDKKIKEILDLVGFNKSMKTKGADLSYGQRKLLDLAISLAMPHKILLLDEPVAGVNPKLRKEIKKIIKKLNKKGETILVIEHDMNFIMDLVDEIFVLDAGKIIAKGKPKQIQNNKKVLKAYLGE